MKATGIIRRIDDLGRVVIPKEIRRTMGVREGDPFEIYIEGKDTICFRKYGNSLNEEINYLYEQIKTNGNLSPDAQMKIGTLLDVVRNMVKGEE